MDKTLPIILELDVPKHADEILSFTKTVLSAILAHKDLTKAQQQRIKLIVVELVTNSIKHAVGKTSQIKLLIDHPTLTIQKLEKGLQIEFTSSHQQIPFAEIDKTINIAFSEENKYQIQTLDKYKFQFLNSPSAAVNIEDIPEHFGFYIITMASDSFVYQYDPISKENQYIVRINTSGN
jgi:hypothetical protein